MSWTTIYSGPGKVVRAADTNVLGGVTYALAKTGFQVEGANGEIKLQLVETASDVSAAMYGKLGEMVEDQIIDLTFKPLDNWGFLGQLFPPHTGVKLAAQTGGTNSVTASNGVVAIGVRPHGAANVKTSVYTPDGRLYEIVRTAVIGHPNMHFGVNKPLYDTVKIIGVGDTVSSSGGLNLGSSGWLIAGNAITESSGTDPEGTPTTTMSDFVRSPWTGAWGTNITAIQAEEEWTLMTDVKYSPLKVQGVTIAYKLDSVAYALKCRPFGMTQSALLGFVGAHSSGMRLGSGVSPSVKADLVLTAALGGRTVTLHNAELKGFGADFGGTKLGNDEIAFVNYMNFTSGVPTALLEFSA